jgi:hypothetical protein
MPELGPFDPSAHAAVRETLNMAMDFVARNRSNV